MSGDHPYVDFCSDAESSLRSLAESIIEAVRPEKWEHLRISVDPRVLGAHVNEQERLRAACNQGWEIASTYTVCEAGRTIQINHLLKRPKASP